MIWKELHTGGATGFARFVGWLLTLILGGLLVYYGVWYGHRRPSWRCGITATGPPAGGW